MITIREIQNDEENFNWWLTIMPDMIQNIQLLSKNIREKLDFSVKSLGVLEMYIIENYTFEDLISPSCKMAKDLFSRYVRETFRKNIEDTIWEMESREGYFGRKKI